MRTEGLKKNKAKGRSGVTEKLAQGTLKKQSNTI